MVEGNGEVGVGGFVHGVEGDAVAVGLDRLVVLVCQ
jgi:hypothetical protein